MRRENYIDLISPSRIKKKDDELNSEDSDDDSALDLDVEIDENIAFTHLHCHSKFSVLQATAGIKDLVQKAKKLNMPAVALTDLGNMYGAFSFVAAANDAGIKPIVGCEFYVVEDRRVQNFTRDNRDKRYQIPIYAKNQNGYKNLAKLSSIGFTEGYYYKFARIDKEVIKEYAEDLICLSGGIRGELADLILNKGEEYAEEALLWWKDVFGDDFYLEVIDHGLDEERKVIEVFKEFSIKHNVKLVATNNVFYLEKEDSEAHDALICIDDGKLKSTPIGRGKDFRYGFPNNEFYFKTTYEMKELFADLRQAILNTQEIVADMGFAGYFLIVQDFIAVAKEMGVFVGPGRGSAAGSVVAYCTGITNIDPLQYDLLFERFLNPERVSMHDIDIDFDEDGRQRVIEYVVNKYGKNQVAHIITFGSMAARSSVRDVARVLDLPLSDACRIASLIPERPGTSLDDAFGEVKELRDIKAKNDLEGETLKMDHILEG